MDLISKNKVKELFKEYRDNIESRPQGKNSIITDLVFDDRDKKYKLITTINGYNKEKDIFYNWQKNSYKVTGYNNSKTITVLMTDSELYRTWKVSSTIKRAEEEIKENIEYMINKLYK